MTPPPSYSAHNSQCAIATSSSSPSPGRNPSGSKQPAAANCCVRESFPARSAPQSPPPYPSSTSSKKGCRQIRPKTCCPVSPQSAALQRIVSAPAPPNAPQRAESRPGCPGPASPALENPQRQLSQSRPTSTATGSRLLSLKDSARRPVAPDREFSVQNSPSNRKRVALRSSLL